MKKETTQKRFEHALDSFVEKAKKDQNIIAVVVYGSFAYDTVWEKSDVDMSIIIRDQKIETKSYAIDEDNLTLNVTVTLRSDFKRNLEKMTGGSIGHSIMAKGRILYTTDDSLYDYFEDIKQIGNDDKERSFFYNSGELIGYMHKIEKWIKVKKDLTYSRLYVLKAAQVLAVLEVCLHQEIPTREAILQADKLNHPLMEKFYYTPMKKELTEQELYEIIDGFDEYLVKHIDFLINIAKECLGDGEIKTMTQISNYYRVEAHYIINVFDFLHEKGVIEKLSQTIRITPKGKMLFEEIAFVMPLSHF